MAEGSECLVSLAVAGSVRSCHTYSLAVAREQMLVAFERPKITPEKLRKPTL